MTHATSHPRQVSMRVVFPSKPESIQGDAPLVSLVLESSRWYRMAPFRAYRATIVRRYDLVTRGIDRHNKSAYDRFSGNSIKAPYRHLVRGRKRERRTWNVATSEDAAIPTSNSARSWCFFRPTERRTFEHRELQTSTRGPSRIDSSTTMCEFTNISYIIL